MLGPKDFRDGDVRPTPDVEQQGPSATEIADLLADANASDCVRRGEERGEENDEREYCNCYHKQDLRTRAAWKEAGRRVPTKTQPARIESYLVPGYSTVYRDRHLFAFEQTVEITAEHQAKREQAALKAKSTRRENLLKWAETVELTIVGVST